MEISVLVLSFFVKCSLENNLIESAVIVARVSKHDRGPPSTEICAIVVQLLYQRYLHGTGGALLGLIALVCTGQWVC